MYKDKKVVAIMPAFNAAKTIHKTYTEVLLQEIVDHIIIVDDASNDRTIEIAKTFSKAELHVHPENSGYGANQKSCYKMALDSNADIIIMVHPDYQYTPKLIPAMASMIGNGLYHCVLGSRILGGYALKGGMPLWKYISNRILTLIENILIGAKLSEYHSGYRAYSRELLQKIPFEKNSNNFIFDNQILVQIVWLGYHIAEISCPTRYSPEASSINFIRSLVYGIGCIITALKFRFSKFKIFKSKLFEL